MAFTTPHLNSSWRVSGAGFRHAKCEKARKVVKIRAKSEFLSGPGAWCGSDGRAKPFVIRQRRSHQHLRRVPQLQRFTIANPFGSLTCHRPNLLFEFSFPSQLFLHLRRSCLPFKLPIFLQALLRPAPSYYVCSHVNSQPTRLQPVGVWMKVSATSLRRLEAASRSSLWLMNNLSH